MLLAMYAMLDGLIELLSNSFISIFTTVVLLLEY